MYQNKLFFVLLTLGGGKFICGRLTMTKIMCGDMCLNFNELYRLCKLLVSSFTEPTNLLRKSGLMEKFCIRRDSK
jgi:hypothetical protein